MRHGTEEAGHESWRKSGGGEGEGSRVASSRYHLNLHEMRGHRILLQIVACKKVCSKNSENITFVPP